MSDKKDNHVSVMLRNGYQPINRLGGGYQPIAKVPGKPNLSEPPRQAGSAVIPSKKLVKKQQSKNRKT